MIHLKHLSRSAAVLAAVLSLGAAPAAASSTQDVFFEAPRDLTAASSTPAGRAAAFTELDGLGVKALRVNLRWFDVAPSADQPVKPAFDATDPSAYAWGNYAAAIDEAKARGWKVLISPASDVPKWATAAKADYVTRPSAAEFKLFTTAVARRFGGPSVIWSIWNEPNLPRFLRPQVSGGKPVAGRLYRELFVAGRAGIVAGGQPSAPVLFGETAPVGGSNDGRLQPLVFLRDALCISKAYKRDKACSTLTLSGIAHHPYQFSGGKPKPDDVTFAVLSRLTTFLDKAAKAGAVNKGLPIFLTEFGIQSLPDRFYGVSQQEQLERRARTERLAYFNRRVRGFSQYLLTDDNPTLVNGVTGYGGFETGFRDHTGRAKLALSGFGLVLDVKPSGKKVSLWGLVRRSSGATTVVIERRVGKGAFKTWITRPTKSNGAFTASDRLRKGAQYRVRWTSPTGVVRGPFVRVFKG